MLEKNKISGKNRLLNLPASADNVIMTATDKIVNNSHLAILCLLKISGKPSKSSDKFIYLCAFNYGAMNKLKTSKLTYQNNLPKNTKRQYS